MVTRESCRSGRWWFLGVLFFAAAVHAGTSEVPADLGFELVADGLDRPILVTGAGDGSGRLFVVEQGGRIVIAGGGVFLDIESRVDSSGNEQGLLGLAFHPDFASNGYFFVNYTHDPGVGSDTTRVSRFEVSAADPGLADAESEVIILEFEQPADNHNGGDLHFGPDGFLYVASGDGGGSGDTFDNGQNKGTLLAALLRIDVDSASPYAVPGTNPFVGVAGALPEIWSYGLRNPWRFSFDRANGDLYIGDVGQGAVEEVNFRPASSPGGENYGWSCMEGDQMPAYRPCDGSPLTAPVLVYGHDVGCSVTGGYLYRGDIGGLHGRYVFGDYCSGRLWWARPGPGGWTVEEGPSVGFGLASFGEDDDGELYRVDRDDGTVHRFASPSAIFADFFEFGGADRWSGVESSN